MKELSLFVVFFLLQTVSYAEPVEDNSFLVEEAYNQEPGVVQFINVYQKAKNTKDWSYVFINEIPVISQQHQFSYELPYSYLESADKSAMGDVKLNYRNEFLRDERLVTTGRVSVATSSGDYKEGFGAGANSYEVSLLTSVKVVDKYIQHWNIGKTFTPNARNTTGDKANNSRYFWNLSNIYLFTDNLNFMLELTSTIEEYTVGPNATTWGSSFLVSPSIRYAIDVGGWQFVPGIAAPFNVGLNAGAENQTLAYLSIEGKLW